MSYSKFKNEMLDVWEKSLKSKKFIFFKKTITEIVDEASWIVLNKWIKEGQMKGLVEWAVSNFDTMSGDKFIWRISDELVKRKDKTNLRKLWKGIISQRRRHFGNTFPKDSINLTPQKQKEKQAVLSAMKEYIETLKVLNDQIEAKRVQEDVDLFIAGKKRKSTLLPDKRKITDDLFWQLIDETKKSSNICSEQVDILTEKLECFSETEIRKFQKLFERSMDDLYSWDIWALAFISRGGCSDDEFDYFRAWLIWQGKEAFDVALVDIYGVANCITGEDPQCENLLYAVETAFENKTGRELVSKRKIVPLKGHEWKENTLIQQYPELCKQFRYV
jgi:hypothetical protein